MSAQGGVAMTDLFLLSEVQMRRIEPFFPLSHGVPRVDDRRVISGIVFVIRNGLRWRDALMLPALPKAKELLGDKGYDAGWFRKALAERGITACIPSKSNRKKPIEHDRTLYRQRHKIENMFGRLKDWRRVHTRYDRCAHTFMSAICIAAIIIFWL